eukprot:scaffold27062_cov139-Skeletonema_menzelii.AAC.12
MDKKTLNISNPQEAWIRSDKIPFFCTGEGAKKEGEKKEESSCTETGSWFRESSAPATYTLSLYSASYFYAADNTFNIANSNL